MVSEQYRFGQLDLQEDRSGFSCGNEQLDNYFRRQAGQDVRRGLAAVYVMHDIASSEVAGYYTLSACSIDPGDLPEAMTRRFPRYREFPAILLGRLAISTNFQGKGFGRRLLVNALRRAHEESLQLGAIAVVVDAIDDDAIAFYQYHDFQLYQHDTRRLFIPMQTIRSLIDS